MWIKEQRREGGITCVTAQVWVCTCVCIVCTSMCNCYPAYLSIGSFWQNCNCAHTSGICPFLWTSTYAFCLYLCVYRVKSSSSSLFCRVCLGWAMFAQLGSDWSRRLMSSSLDQEALMVSFSSHWTIPLGTHRHTQWHADSVVVVVALNRHK